MSNAGQDDIFCLSGNVKPPPSERERGEDYFRLRKVSRRRMSRSELSSMNPADYFPVLLLAFLVPLARLRSTALRRRRINLRLLSAVSIAVRASRWKFAIFVAPFVRAPSSPLILPGEADGSRLWY